MALTIDGFEGSGTFAHGVHPPENKMFSTEMAIEVVPQPSKVLLPLSQHVGAPCQSIVKPKQSVAFGEMVAKGGGFVSAALHAPIAGKIQRNVVTTLPQGRRVEAIAIKSDGEQLEGDELLEEIFGGKWPTKGLEKYDPQQISNAIHDAGIVGLGGAAFPTHVKLMSNDKADIDTFLINGCECEPFLTCDYRMMIEAAGPIITGALLGARAVGAKNIAICIEDNKPRAINVLQKAADGTGIKIAVLKTKYPQGSEKQLIMAVTKRAVPLGGLPMNVGVAVSNVGTIAAVARAVLRGKPLTHRAVSITGGGILNPKNLLVAVGTPIRELFDYCGGFRENAARVISGGPMMGFAFTNFDAPVTKGTSGITVLTREDVAKSEETSCVRCGRCVDGCPMNLVPTKIALASRNKDIDLAQQYNIMACFECGSCAYNCPAGIPLVQLIRTGKGLIMASKKK
ncbi:MAG: electron transport complex subunit RsxC [Desulfobacteraceae bacterium 4572_123]|nr:MAG: electron transport complex subunit RsxC [Desulfobacteraceae bacterium 4572_123]